MSKFDELNDIFEVSGEIVSSKIENNQNNIEKPETISDGKEIIDDIKKDYEYTRGNLYSIIEKGQEAINGILELAQETEMPRAYEVAGQLIKNVSDATEKLMDLQKKLKDLDQDNYKKGPTNVTNALFVGSTAELSKLLKNNQVQKDDK
jgi:uncharacterized protein YaaN involved in tellurite resistance